MNKRPTSDQYAAARARGISASCVQHRLSRGWSIERAITEPPDPHRGAPPPPEADSGQARDVWQPIESLTCDHIDVLLYSADWIDPDFCPSGIREGFRNEDDQGPIFAARWDGDYWVTDEDARPTHWRRKPRPPAALAAQRGEQGDGGGE